MSTICVLVDVLRALWRAEKHLYTLAVVVTIVWVLKEILCSF
jgi:hypothetical protein